MGGQPCRHLMAGSSNDASARHMQTEKRRRDRIAAGFDTLRELVPCKDRKMDKATFLQQVVDYVSQLQGAVQQAVSLGGMRTLPEESQWQVRLLLPRQQSETGQGTGAGSEVPRNVQQPQSGTAQTIAQTEVMGPGQERNVGAQDVGPSLPPMLNCEREISRQGNNSTALGVTQPSAANVVQTNDPQKRVFQLQQMLKQLQSQQAISAQQLQIQQAALMQNQMYNALRLQRLVQQNAGPSLDLVQHTPNLLNTSRSAPPSQLPNEVVEDMPINKEQDHSTPAGALKSASKHSRRTLKVRRHTTAARMSNPHGKPASTSSSGGNSSCGRPECHSSDQS